MAMMVQGSGRIEDEALPVASLAAALRLPDGYEIVPGQLDRLRSRLRAAIATVEDRTGKVLILREVQLRGTTSGEARVPLPVAPVSEILEAEILRGHVAVSPGPVIVEPHPHRPVAVFARALPSCAVVQMAATAGYGAWSDVPAPLQEAVLTIAQGLDIGKDVADDVVTLISPYRPVRIGGGAA